jgi:hypothetical protein
MIVTLSYKGFRMHTTKAYKQKIWIGKSKDWLLDR